MGKPPAARWLFACLMVMAGNGMSRSSCPWSCCSRPCSFSRWRRQSPGGLQRTCHGPPHKASPPSSPCRRTLSLHMPGLSSVLAPPLCCRAKEPSAALACWRAPSHAIPCHSIQHTPGRGKPAGLGRGQSGAIAGCVCPERLPPGACACARTGVDEGGGGGNSRNIFFTLPIVGDEKTPS